MIGQGVGAVHPLPEGAAERFDRFHALLMDWNQRMDLTAITDEEEALHFHYLDSLTAMGSIKEGASCIDVGTGAGFPGMPLMIARPDLAITLLDALKKRIAFLQYAMEALSLPGKAVHARAEDFARTHREAYDVAVSRAVAPLPILLEWLLPLIKVGGQCILWKGPGLEMEMAQGLRVAPLLGGGEIRIKEAPIKGRDAAHVLVFVDKIEKTPSRFPRKAGMAAKRPL